MRRFIDPRSSRGAGPPGAWRRLGTSTEELEDLFRLCRAGRLYEVEEWIADGRPVQVLPSAAPKTWRRRTALKIVLETGQHSLASLLLSNGYRLDLEPNSPFDAALKSRHWDLVDLLFASGADPLKADVYEILYTYSVPIYERFMAAGYDLTERHEMAAMVSKNKPLLGFVKRHRHDRPEFQRELDMALAHHAEENEERGVSLCLWAGANPHAHVPNLRYPELSEGKGDGDEGDEDSRGWSAVEEAVSSGHTAILKRLIPDPAKDDFESLYQSAYDGYTVDALAEISPARNVAAIMLSRAPYWHSRYHFRSGNPVEVIEHVFRAGARWTTSTRDEIAAVRYGILRAKDSSFVELMKLLCQDDRCNPGILKELARTPSMRKRLRSVRLIPGRDQEPEDSVCGMTRPTGGRMIAKKCGIPWPKPKPFVPKVLSAGHWRPGAQRLLLSRRELYEKVWKDPMEKLGAKLGMSGRGLAKLCGRMSVPVPQRGYWAKFRAGAKIRRPKLPPDRLGACPSNRFHIDTRGRV